MQLKALVVRHRRAHEIRTEIITEFLAAFEQANVQTALLKGAALAHLLYPEPANRPMGDVDVLVPTEQALIDQQTLRDLGYSADDRKEGYLYDHHHLPIASNRKAGMQISIEVHHDALSGDVDHSITLHNLAEPLQTFEIDGRTAHAFNHTDMLHHLCHHTFEPADVVKLGSVVDFVGYANKYVAEIDWHRLDKNYPFIINALQCVHFLTPLPEALGKQISIPECAPPDGLGLGFIPLSDLAERPLSKASKLKHLLQPSDWWMHIFYNVSPTKSLMSTRLVHHPIQLAKWLIRRYRAAWRSRSPDE